MLTTDISSRSNSGSLQSLLHRLHMRRFNSLTSFFAVPVLLITLISCDESSYDSASSATTPTVNNTAEVLTPDLTITYPPSNGDDGAFIQVAENDPIVTQVNAQDIPGSQLLYRLQDGQDMNKFIIDENTGSLSFKELPDWEKPHDADKNNNYMVLWQVLSSTGEARSQFLVIQVTDLPD